MLVLVAAFLVLGAWQVGRAEQGNALSYGYAFEWPVFALFVIFVWWREIRLESHDKPTTQHPPNQAAQDHATVHDAASGRLLKRVPTRAHSEVAEPEDAPLSAYNDYLAWLAADPARRPADYPGPLTGG